MIKDFRAFVVHNDNDGFKMGVERLNQDDLPRDEVIVRVAYSVINYKDALVCTPHGGVARVYPLVPGLECVGTVVESMDRRFQPGNAVMVGDCGNTLGVSRHGGFSEYVRVSGDFLLPLPMGLDFKQALVVSAGMTAVMGLRELEKNDLTPRKGPVLVTGATGGVGSVAVRLLASRGYTVAASTGKPDAHDYLRQLGASEILSRQEVEAESTRPLERQRWAGSIDTVGGSTLAYLMRTTQKGGAIAAVGVAGGAAFGTTVFPLILRGIKVLGIDMPSTPLQVSQQLWAELTSEEILQGLKDVATSEISLEDIPSTTKALLKGQTRGRVLVRLGEQ